MKIIPTPNKAELTADLSISRKIAAVAVENGSDRRITKIAVTLKREIEALLRSGEAACLLRRTHGQRLRARAHFPRRSGRGLRSILTTAV